MKDAPDHWTFWLLWPAGVVIMGALVLYGVVASAVDWLCGRRRGRNS